MGTQAGGGVQARTGTPAESLPGMQTRAMAPSSSERDTSSGVEKGQGDLVEQFMDLCGLECKVLAEGEANISGNSKIDAFFAATLKFQAQAASLEAEVRAELAAIAAAAGVRGAARMDIDELVAAIDAEVTGGFDGMIEGGLTIAFTPPKCQVTAKASVEAAAKCDASATPPSASVECKGNCEASAEVMAECSGNAELKCKGTAPSFACTGTCTGTCELTAGGECSGTCEGKCMMDGNTACDGECQGTLEGGNCEGECKLASGATCTGSCEGTCELAAGGECDGQCKGECEYTPGGANCEAGATAKCETKGNATVECEGKCDGEVTPPEVSAECEATAKAEASASAECVPPAVELKYELSARAQGMFEGNASAQAEFEGRLQAVGKAFANVLAKGAKVEAIIASSPALVSASGGAIGGIVGRLSRSGDGRAAFGAYCAGLELEGAVEMLGSATTSLGGTGEAVVEVVGIFGGA